MIAWSTLLIRLSNEKEQLYKDWISDRKTTHMIIHGINIAIQVARQLDQETNAKLRGNHRYLASMKAAVHRIYKGS